jgi:hypothetical protein
MPKRRKPHKVERCTTHHYACNCREWMFKEMEMALRDIQKLTSVDPKDVGDLLWQIRKRCKDVLE